MPIEETLSLPLPKTIPPPLCGRGQGGGVTRGSALENRFAARRAGLIRAYRRETPPPAPRPQGAGECGRNQPGGVQSHSFRLDDAEKRCLGETPNGIQRRISRRRRR